MKKKEQKEKNEEEKDKKDEITMVKESKEEEEEKETGLELTNKSQINESLSMMCPICHLFMYKSVNASCGHMFCQYCLEEYLIFKDSCPV